MKNVEDLFAAGMAARKYATLADAFEDEPGSPIVEVPS